MRPIALEIARFRRDFVAKPTRSGQVGQKVSPPTIGSASTPGSAALVVTET
jgi:hypothetical protein